MLILDPYDMAFDAVGVFGLDFWLLFKSALSYCELAWKLSFQFPSGVTNMEAVDMQPPETEMMYINRALFKKVVKSHQVNTFLARKIKMKSGLLWRRGSLETKFPISLRGDEYRGRRYGVRGYFGHILQKI